MTVNDLFNHFNNYFNRIHFTNETYKIDEVEIFDSPFRTELQDRFINKYGHFIVDDWEFDNNEDNSIWIIISEEQRND